MKKLLLLTILLFSTTTFGQVRKIITKPTNKPVAEVKKEPPTQKVVVEKINGDKITGLFVSGNLTSITVNFSDAEINISLSDIKAIWIGDAKPEPVIQAPTINYAANAIKALKQLSAATEVGVSFQEYGRRLIDTKVELDESLPNISEIYVKDEIKLAIEAYTDAGTAWNGFIQDRYYFPRGEFAKKYFSKTDGSDTCLFERSCVISTIWAAAKKHIENAQRGKVED